MTIFFVVSLSVWAVWVLYLSLRVDASISFLRCLWIFYYISLNIVLCLYGFSSLYIIGTYFSIRLGLVFVVVIVIVIVIVNAGSTIRGGSWPALKASSANLYSSSYFFNSSLSSFLCFLLWVFLYHSWSSFLFLPTDVWCKICFAGGVSFVLWERNVFIFWLI